MSQQGSSLGVRQAVLSWARFALLFVSLLVVSGWIKLDWSLLGSTDGLGHVRSMLAALMQPDLQPDFAFRVLRLMAESIGIGVLGMLGALALGVPLALFAARWPNLMDPPPQPLWLGQLRWCGLWLARSVLSLLRSVPDLVWAFLFVRILGLGPGAAVCAIALSFAGIVGKLYAEIMEACPAGPVRFLRSSGASVWGVFLYGIFPQIRTQWVGYGLFRLECAIRSAAILGLVGAGGIGSEIALSIRYYQYNKLATALLCVFVVVVLFELLSAWLRKQRLWWCLGLGFIASVGSFAGLPVPWSDLFSSQVLEQVASLGQGFLHPRFEWSWLWTALQKMGQTIAMAWVATLLAACFAFFLAPWASQRLWGGGTLSQPPRSLGPAKWVVWPVVAAIRLLFQWTRALPELVWALLVLLWVGPGVLAGTLAIALHTFGILGRLYSETYEEAELPPTQWLEAQGATATGRWLFGMLPSAMPRLMAYTLFRFEVNVRATAVLGFVGAGGIGDAIHTAISLFHFRDLATYLLVLWASVIVIDSLGSRIRQRWLSEPIAA